MNNNADAAVVLHQRNHAVRHHGKRSVVGPDVNHPVFSKMGNLMGSWEEELSCVMKNLELFELLIHELNRKVQDLNTRLDNIEKRKPIWKEFLQN